MRVASKRALSARGNSVIGFEEEVLNASIVRPDISRSFEEYLEIFEAFYAEDIEVSSGTGAEPIRGKARVRSLLLNFLIPLHIMAEVGGLSVSIRNTVIPGDVTDETHTEWTLDLGRCVRSDLYSELAHLPQMERTIRDLRASL